MYRWLAALARVHRPDPDGRVHIAGRAIYVLPTRYGLLFLVLVLALLVGAINYANNPAFLVTFALAGAGLATLVQTWRNLRGLQLRLVGDQPDFAGGTVGFRFRVASDRPVDRPAIQLQWADLSGVPRATDLPGGEGAVVLLRRAAGTRGRCPAGRLLVSTRYPLGIIQAWCYLEFDAWVPVYPRPAPQAVPPAHPSGGLGTGSRVTGTEDFAGLRTYRPGDPLRRIDWKALAAERGLHTRTFASGGGEPLWLDWAAWPELGVEARLSLLSRAVVDAHLSGRRYGLRLPAVEIAPGSGETHRRTCLTALAVYGEAP